MNVAPSGIVWSGMSVIIGLSFIGVTVNVAASEPESPSVSVAMNVIVSAPFQLIDGVVIVAIWSVSIVIISSSSPVYVHVKSSSGSSMSVSYTHLTLPTN